MPTTPVKKKAIRKMVRGTVPPYRLEIQFLDALTGEVLTDLTGYEVIDQGTDIGPLPGTGTSTPTTPTTSGNKGGNGHSYDGGQDPFDYAAFQNRPGASRGTGNIFTDLVTTFDQTKTKIKDFTDAIKENIIPGSTGRVDPKTGLTNIPPIGGGAAVARPSNLVRDPLISQPSESTDRNLNLAKSEQTAARSGSGAIAMPPELAAISRTDTRSSDGSRSLNAADKSDLVTTTLPSRPVSSDAAVDNIASRNISFNPSEIDIRDKPIEQATLDAVAAALKATDSSLTVRVNSGGQVPESEGGVGGVDRTLSHTTNHDVTGTGKARALDIQVFDSSGNRITPASNPEVFQEFAKNAAIAGMTQIGMGGGIVHFGLDSADKSLRTWGYDSAGNVIAAPKIVTDAVKEAAVIKANDPEAGAKLMGGIAPIPTSRGMVAANSARSLFELPAIGVGAARDALTGAIGGALDPFAGANLGETFNQSVPMFGTVGNALVDAGNAALKGGKSMSGNAIRDEIKKSGVIGEGFGAAARGIVSGIQSVGEMAKGFNPVSQLASLASGFMTPPASAPLVASQSAKELQTNMGLAGIDAGQIANTAIRVHANPDGSVKFLVNKTGAPLTDADIENGNMVEITVPKGENLQNAIKTQLGSQGGNSISQPMPAPLSLDDPKRMDAIVRTILGEAAGEGMEGQAAIANVIKNRALSGKYPVDPLDVVNQQNRAGYFQFSANAAPSKGGNNIADKYVPGTPEYEQAKKIAELVFSGELPDNTGGSVMYNNPKLVTPGWADEETNNKYGTMEIGNHRFYPQKEISGGYNAREFLDPTSTTATGAKITPVQQNAISSTGGLMTRPQTSTASSSSPFVSEDRPKSNVGVFSPISSPKSSNSVTTIGSNGLSSGSGVVARPPTSVAASGVRATSSGSSSTTIGSNGLSSSESERTSAAKSGSSGTGGVMSSPPSSAPKTTSSAIKSGSSAVGSAAPKASSTQKVTTSSGGTITKAQSDAIRKL